MSYIVNMEATNVELEFPIERIVELLGHFEKIVLTSGRYDTKFACFRYSEEEEDIELTELNAEIYEGRVIFDRDISTECKASSDGGLMMLLERFKGSANITLRGEDGTIEFIRYTNGKSKSGKVVFDED